MKKTKKNYKIGDSVWIYGISAGPGYNLPTKGRIVHEMEIANYSGVHYVIAVSNGIEDLLEVRTWEEISQDEKGPIGSFRELLMNDPVTQRKLSRTGMRLPDVELNPDFVNDEQDQESN
jgi:hypothetical protein